MSDERALLASIWEHPHEDTPRLVCADWLEESGSSPRAEFIRVRCANWMLLNGPIRDRIGTVFRAPRRAGRRVLRMEVNGNGPADLTAFDTLASRAVLPQLEELHLPFSSYCLPEAMFEKLRARFGKNPFL